METKRCDHCGRDFSRPSSFSPAVWRRQRYCSLPCANRARAERARKRGSEIKPCEHCGAEMMWPRNYTARQWATKRYCDHKCAGAALRARTDAERPPRRCVICGAEYRWRPEENQRTCRSAECLAEYARTVSGPARAERMRADYAVGKRKPAPGISPRERELWPLLAHDGWVWRLRWIEETAEFELDFAHRELMLNVEIDGVEHREPRGVKRDAVRDAALEAQGWRILRIPNEDIDADVQGVAERVTNWARDSRAQWPTGLSATSSSAISRR